MSAPTERRSLTARLREATWAAHRSAERGRFVHALLQGQLDAAAYALLLQNLLPIYQALEAGLDQHLAHPQLLPLGATPLYRAAALHHDLAALAASAEAPVLPAAHAYAGRLRTLASQDPLLLAAHAYVRYLGDLNGGQILARAVARATAAARAPLRFHDFGAPEAVRQLASHLRAGLDSLPLDEPEVRRLEAEALDAFQRHLTLFDELARACGLQPGALSAAR